MGNHKINRFVDTECIVVGASLAAISAALEGARQGNRTALVMHTNSPVLEFGTSMGAWLTESEAELMPGNLRDALLTDAGVPTAGGTEPFRLLDQTIALTRIEDLLLDAGISIFYGARPIGPLVNDVDETAKAAGVLFGGKFGTAAATGGIVIDCTAHASLVHSAGGGTWIGSEDESEYSLVLLTKSDAVHEAQPFSDGVSLTRRGPLAELRFRGSYDSAGLHIRRILISHLAEWNREHPGRHLKIELSSDELLTAPGVRLKADGFAGPDITGVEGLYCVGAAADSTIRSGVYLDCRTRYVSRAMDGVSGLPMRRKAPTASAYRLLQPVYPGESISPDYQLRFDDPAVDEPCVDAISVKIPPVPIIRDADLAIVGAGTSGAVAAYQAGTLGIPTVCIEAYSDVGGVSTVGGVPAYWFGRRTPFFKRLHGRIKREVREKDLSVALALLGMIEDAGTEVLLGTQTAGVAVNGESVGYAVVVTAGGLAAIGARGFIDATGDGDIAAWSGAGYTYGTGRDEATLWCSFGSFQRGRDEALRQFMSVADQRSVHDYTRAIVAGRRMGSRRGPYIQHYLALRESRHITGSETVKYRDVMMGRAFPNSVLYFKSDVDIKGVASSREALCGYIEVSFLQNYSAGVPYGAIVPRNLDNVLVAGRAYSATHDASGMARMQPDVMSLGAVAVYAFGRAMRDAGGKPSQIDVAALQAELMENGILVNGDLPNGPMDERIPPEDDELLIEVMERLNTHPAESSEWARIFARADSARRYLDRRGIVNAESTKPQIDHLCAALGDSRGNDRLLERLDAMLTGSELPDIGGLHSKRHDVPDMGFAPEPVYLINALAQTRDPRLAARLRRVADMLCQIDPAVSDCRFSYLHSIGYAAELLATPEAGAVAEEMMLRSEIHDQLIRRGPGMDARATSDYIAERYAYLGLCLARGAARCGLISGYARLADYLEEMRLYLARSARRELVELVGCDHGFDREKWNAEIENKNADKRICPQAFSEIIE